MFLQVILCILSQYVQNYRPTHEQVTNQHSIRPAAQNTFLVIPRDLARNEEFSEIAVINIFFTVLQTKTSYLWGGVLRGKFRGNVTCVPIHCVIIGLNVIAIDKYNYMIILF